MPSSNHCGQDGGGYLQSFDRFVRGLPWDSLGLTPDMCTGDACGVERSLPIHGALPEQIAMLVVAAKVKDVFPREMPSCEQAALESALTAEIARQASGEPEPIQIVASCEPRKKTRVTFLRLTLSQDLRDKLEKESPDGLSLRDPITFVIVNNNGKDAYYTQMHDGRFDAATVTRVLQALNDKRLLIFAKADK